MPAQPLSPSQLADATRLKNLFKEWQLIRKQQGLPFSQEAASEILGFGQSALAQYLNGRIPLNVDAGTKFAALLEIPLGKFSPTLAEQASRFTKGISHTPSTVAMGGVSGLPARLQSMVLLELLTEREAALLHKFRVSSDDGKDYIESIAELAEKGVFGLSG